MEEEFRRIIREEVIRAFKEVGFPEVKEMDPTPDEAVRNSVMDVKQLSKYIKRSVSWIYKNIHDIPKKRAGGGDSGSYFFLREEIDEWIRSGKTNTGIYLKKTR